MAEGDCMVDIAKFYLGFCVAESCGKCAPCRIGGSQMLDVLVRISKGQAQSQDLEKLHRISFAMQKASLCGLGQTAPNPVISTLKHFLAEYKEHIENKRCPAGKCLDLLSYKIIDEKCKRCGACVRICPVSAISGNREHGYNIDTQKCTKCGQCISVCKFKAISKE
jgi:ferredoxin